MSQGAPPRRTMIPAAPIVRVIRAWLEREWAEHQETFRDGDESVVRRLNPTHRLCELVGFDEENLSKLLNKQKWVDFDKADKILTRLHLVDQWTRDPELAAIYEGLDLTPLDLTRPTCEAAEQEARERVLELLRQGHTRKQAGAELGVGAMVITRLSTGFKGRAGRVPRDHSDPLQSPIVPELLDGKEHDAFDLSQRLGVSRMSVHRYLEPLIDAGHVTTSTTHTNPAKRGRPRMFYRATPGLQEAVCV